MNRTILAPIIGVLGGLLLASGPGIASETPETILIRSTLANEMSGRRRVELDLTMSAYHDDFAAFRAHGNADPRAWTVEFENLGSYAEHLENELSRIQYDTHRPLPFIHVRGDYAMVTSIDSGLVVDRSTGTQRVFGEFSFWTLRKIGNIWLITSLVADVGDSILALETPAGSPAQEIAEFLQNEANGWIASQANLADRLYDDHFVGMTGGGNANPQSWEILFAGAGEFDEFLGMRLANTSYTVDREVLYTAVGAQGNEAVAVTRESIRTAHKLGDAVHQLERDVLWKLSRRAGSWRVRQLCYDVELGD